MARYFLHFRTSVETVPDLEGGEHPNLAAARAEAVAAARDMVSELVRAGKSIDKSAIEICDLAGNVIETVTLTSVVR